MKLFVKLLLLMGTKGDVFMHNPRGSNDRNCERNANRDNGNRLFDSQNNNAGGYACPRGVGDENFQNEMGESKFSDIDVNTGTTYTFTQNKRMYYYEGSILPIEWTEQHGCGSNSKVSCEISIQYACEDTLDPKEDDFYPWVANKAQKGTKYRGKQHFRSTDNSNGYSHIAAPRDGVPVDSHDAATRTIPDNEDSAIPSTKQNRAFGMQESFDFYQLCQHTERNKGLYTADQQILRSDKRGTRQNPIGNRHGFECPEERDYYPWWHPSPWIDIAILTDTADDDVCLSSNISNCSLRCQYYMNNTMNYAKKGYCDANHINGTVSTKLNSNAWRKREWYNNKAACETAGFVWYEISTSDILDLGADNQFVCAKTQFSRVNQLGNARADSVYSQSLNAQTSGTILKSKVNEGLNANRFLWKIPTFPKAQNQSSHANIQNAYKSCVIRIRYNITSADFQPWPNDANKPGSPRMVDHLNNSKYKNDPSVPLRQDPYIYIGPGDTASHDDMFLSLAVNTNQYSRVFQDRSYVFTIMPLPSTNQPKNLAADRPAINSTEVKKRLAKGGQIFNVNVRGKRGNIVQTFPSVEYDFVPNALALTTNDMVHFQWQGSDYNPRRGCNNGEGGPPDLNTYVDDSNAGDNSRADRSNVVFMNHMGNNIPRNYAGYNLSDTTLDRNTKLILSKNAILSDAVCYNPEGGDDISSADECFESVMRLAYLNQQRDGGSLILRQGRKCLTQAEIEAILDENRRQNHPLNCAKLNAKPFPYFDGGIVFIKRSGWFPFFSSRNNNFSNRQQIGVICVGNSSHPCPIDNSTGVLQDVNPLYIHGTADIAPSTSSQPQQTINSSGLVVNGICQSTTGPNSNAVISCIVPNASLLDTETVAIQEGDNDNVGDGQKKSCQVYEVPYVTEAIQDPQIMLALVLLFVGLFTSWLAYYIYNISHAKPADQSKYRGDEAWKNQTLDIGATQSRPLSALFVRTNPKYMKPPTDLPPPPPIPAERPISGSNSTSSPRSLSVELPRASGAFNKSFKIRSSTENKEETNYPASNLNNGNDANNTTTTDTNQATTGSNVVDTFKTRYSSPRTKEFAMARSQVRKPPKGPKLSEMI